MQLFQSVIMNSARLMFSLICLLSICYPSYGDSTFKIGIAVCLTGACAETGTNSQRGAELAAQEINSSGGVLGRKIELVVQDTREAESGVGAVNAFRSMSTDSDIKYFIGPTWTPGGLALASIVSKMREVIITSPTLGVAAFNEAGDNIFNLWPHDEVATRALARYAFNNGMKKAGILSSQQPWCLEQGRFFADEFKKSGGVVTALEEPLPNSSDLRTEVYRISITSPDVIFFSNYLHNGISADILRKYKYKGKLLLILLDQTQLELAHGALEGAMYASYPASNADFVKKYLSTFKVKPGNGSDTAYDTVKLYARSIEEARSFDASVVKKILNRQRYDGASGKIVFDEKGGVKKSPFLFRVKGSEVESLEALN